MGRPRKGNLKGHRTKKEKAERIDMLNNHMLKQELGLNKNISAPAFLCSEAKKEFNRIVSAYEKLGTLDELDLSVLAVYADAWANYERLAKIISETGPVIIKRRVTGRTEVFSNPAVSAQAEYVHRIMQCSLKLGMATTDRLRLSVPKVEEEEDGFSEFEGKV